MPGGGRAAASPPNNHIPLPPHIIPTMPPSKPQIKHLARNLRNNPTDAEHILWQHIRMGQLDGHRFLRQRVIENMIVDFICRGRKLIIELDGGQHDQQRTADNLRTQRLNQHGYRVLRFWNNEITTNIEAVLQTIQQALKT